jgi:hypothetical protein
MLPMLYTYEALCPYEGELKREGKERESETIIGPRIHRRQLMES